jgi:proliferating cell nuclear antigen
MNLSIQPSLKKNVFISLIQLLKNCSSNLCITFNNDTINIQGMDKSHVCLYNINLLTNWFHTYEQNNASLDKICIDSKMFFTILNYASDFHNINIHYETNSDILNIDLIVDENSKGDFNKYFKLPLNDSDYEIMNIPSTQEYDAEFSITSKKICEIINQMFPFGTEMTIKCSDERIELISNGLTGEMMVNIPIDDLNEYSITENEMVELSYSLQFIQNMCLTSKLSNEIQFFISKELPMKIKYDLGDSSYLEFFIAPKIMD